mgnify:CR=1 FL=1
MTRYLADKDPNDDFIDDPNVVSRAYCKQTGKLAGDKCSDTGIGYYDISNLPAVCDGVHPNSSSSDLNSSQVASIPARPYRRLSHRIFHPVKNRRLRSRFPVKIRRRLPLSLPALREHPVSRQPRKMVPQRIQVNRNRRL